MSQQLLLIAVAAVTALATAGLMSWSRRPRPTRRRIAAAPQEDMFAYTMQDDPC
jgi:hypothetical protein